VQHFAGGQGENKGAALRQDADEPLMAKLGEGFSDRGFRHAEHFGKLSLGQGLAQREVAFDNRLAQPMKDCGGQGLWPFDGAHRTLLARQSGV